MQKNIHIHLVTVFGWSLGQSSSSKTVFPLVGTFLMDDIFEKYSLSSRGNHFFSILLTHVYSICSSSVSQLLGHAQKLHRGAVLIGSQLRVQFHFYIYSIFIEKMWGMNLAGHVIWFDGFSNFFTIRNGKWASIFCGVNLRAGEHIRVKTSQ